MVFQVKLPQSRINLNRCFVYLITIITQSSQNFNPLLPQTFFRQILRCSLKWAPIVYRLMDAAFIGNFSHDLFFLNEILIIR